MQNQADVNSSTPLVLACWKDAKPVACLPFYEKKRLQLLMAYNAVSVYYSPVVFRLTDRILPNHNLLLQYEITGCMGKFLKQRYFRINLNLLPDVYDTRGFREAGIDVVPLYTYIKQLRNPIPFFNHEMTSLRKARKQEYDYNVEYRSGVLPDLLYRMFARKDLPFNIAKCKLHFLLDSLVEAGLVEQHNLISHDRIVSSCIIITGIGNTAYAMATASEPEDMKAGASILLYSHIFDNLAKRYLYLDLCGANSFGPSRLKAAMGAELKVFFRLSK